MDICSCSKSCSRPAKDRPSIVRYATDCLHLTFATSDIDERPLCAAGSTGQRNTLIFYQGWSVDMKQRRRIYYSAAQRSEIWDRWQAGEPMSAIGRRFDRESSSVFSVISPTGGIR